MGYLDGTSVTVDAVLTKKGREILSDPSKGSLNISSFTLSDQGIDYTLWNPDHPSGSAFYGEAIENLPMLESSVHAEYNLRNRLITLGQDTSAMPALEVRNLTSSNTLTFEDTDVSGLSVNIELKNWSAGMSNVEGLYAVVSDPSVATVTNGQRRKGISGITRTFLREQNFPDSVEIGIKGAGPEWKIHIKPDTELTKKGRQMSVYVVHPSTGTWSEFVVVNNIERLIRGTRTNPVGS